MTGLHILSTGSQVPAKVVTNAMMEQVVDTSNEWIVTRTGIESRHIADGETTLSLATSAAKEAISNSGIDISEIGLVICATVSHEYLTPSLSCMVQRDLGLSENVLVFDLNAACSGFIFSLHTAYSILLTARYNYALIIASEVLSRITNFQDRSTCVLFGDGAGAAVVTIRDNKPHYFNSGAKGDSDLLYCLAHTEPNNPFNSHVPENNGQFLHMEGSEVFRFAVESIKNSVNKLFEETGLTAAEIDHYVMHQANARIITSAMKKLDIPMEKCFINIESHGNTSAASVPIALHSLNKTGKLARGDKIIFAGFGSGLAYGALYMEW